MVWVLVRDQKEESAMAEEPVEVARNDWAVILHHDRWKTVELRWLPTTRDMGDEGFKDSLALLAEAGERFRTPFMFVDSIEFHHRPSAEVLEWRNQHIVPRYNSAGVTRFAFLVPEGFPGTVESGAAPAPDGPATFPTAWFSTRDHAYQWLTE
jgi:hypothetical protein